MTCTEETALCPQCWCWQPVQCQRSACCQPYHLMFNVTDINNSEVHPGVGSHLKTKGQWRKPVFAAGSNWCQQLQADEQVTSPGRHGGRKCTCLQAEQTQKQQISLVRYSSLVKSVIDLWLETTSDTTLMAENQRCLGNKAMYKFWECFILMMNIWVYFKPHTGQHLAMFLCILFSCCSSCH